MPVTRVHVNRAHMAANLKDGGRRPVYTVKARGVTRYAHAVEFTGPATLVDPRHHRPLSCGARAWIETHHPVVLVDPCSFDEARLDVTRMSV